MATKKDEPQEPTAQELDALNVQTLVSEVGEVIVDGLLVKPVQTQEKQDA